ncbi:uncharacterized protein LOC141620238 [Silene latifolia]|uniref:uncharacterized protein LOC141620238 n=1 Tax=Silene latifolia TaxID=37657 RepID=UPI003D76A790
MVYASNNARVRDDLWTQLVSISGSVKACVLLGDFNVVRDVSERISNTPPTFADILDFNSCLLKCGVDDIRGTGCEMTWTNKQDIETLVWSKLDRALANTDWLAMFPGLASSTVGLHPNYQSTVKEAWLEPVTGSHIYKLFAKMKNVKARLITLHKRSFSKISQRVTTCNEELNACQQSIQDNLFFSCFVGLENVASSFVDYYKSLLGAAIDITLIDEKVIQQGPCIQADDLPILLKPVDPVEIKNDVFSIGSDKSPGPDGFSSEFFKSSWHTMGPDFCKAIQAYVTHGRLSKQANATLITLIPKKKVCNTVMDFRPISCCTTFYKTISKILSQRLQSILPRIIGPEQAAFIKGRDIHENIMMSQALVKGYDRKYLTPRCLIKVDIRKAFDSLQWGFVKSMLSTLNFPTTFIDWIMGCISSSWFSIKLNGSVHGFFKEESGLRGDMPSVTVVLNTLKEFSSWSGLSANIDKTDIYFGGISSPVKAQILSVTGFSEGTFPFRYLGLPLDNAIIHADTYGVLITKIQAHLQHWSLFLCWEGSNRLTFHSWRSVCSPWENEGFGIKEILSWNKAVLAKKLWTLDTKKSGLWFSWNKAYNFPHSTIWEVQSKHHHSESFRSIITVKNELILRTGTSTAAAALFHSWIQGGTFCLGKAYTWFKGTLMPHPWAPTLKHSYILPSHRIITSLAMQGHLATVDNLHIRGLLVINRCVLCKAANESHAHLFLLPQRSTDCISELLWSLYRKRARHWKNGWFRSCLAAVCYHLWPERNRRLFQGIEQLVEKIVRTIQFQISVQVLHNISCAQYDRAVQSLNSLAL